MPWMEAMLTMRPQFRAVMPGSNALMAWKLADRLRAMMASHLLSGNSAMGLVNWMPALFTRMSTWPRRCSASAHMSRICAGSERSAAECGGSAVLPALATSRWAAVMSSAEPKPFSITRAPAAASILAMPSPIPLVEPVTRAVRPDSV
jgi:hypothetical protein